MKAEETKKPKRAAKADGVQVKMGRPTLYRPEYAAQSLKLCRLGATDKEIANFFDVSVDTIHDWKKAHPEFLHSLKEGKELADAEVADKLFKRATGYEHSAVKISASPDGKEHVTEYTERYPPDTTAAIFWLKNRRPDMWRDKVQSELTGADGGPIDMSLKVSFVKPRGD